jgi:hypothetical protein
MKMKKEEHIDNQERPKIDNQEVAVEGLQVLTLVDDDNVFIQLPVYSDETGLTKESLLETTLRVRDLWGCMNTKKDLLHLLNVTLAGIYGEHSTMITMKQLTRFAFSSNESKRYTTFQIPKKRKGEFRTIDAPVPMLKYIQRGLNFILQSVYTPHTAAMGFVQHRSVVDNAKVHTGQRLVYNIDLKDFFPSITAGRLYHRLMSKPFTLNEEVASVITDLCCYTNAEGRHVLPQGAPTSPTITNIICERLDIKLSRLAKAYGLKYTRYADDISFSGMANVFSNEGKFCQSMRHIIEEEEHFTINNDKTRLCHRGMRQEVTGLTVNQQENVSRKYIKQLRTLIHNWEMNGYEKAQEVFVKHYAETNTRNVMSKGIHHIENIIAGKLMFLKMVKGGTDNTYKNLNERFQVLMRNRPKVETEVFLLPNDWNRGPDNNSQNVKPLDEEQLPSLIDGKDDDLLSVFSELEELLNTE